MVIAILAPLFIIFLQYAFPLQHSRRVLDPFLVQLSPTSSEDLNVSGNRLAIHDGNNGCGVPHPPIV